MEAVPPYSKSKSVFFNILYPASGNEFSTYENNIFFVGAILLLIEIISEDSGSFFLLVETSISTKSFILFFFFYVHIYTIKTKKIQSPST